jgi:hypothetical protein
MVYREMVYREMEEEGKGEFLYVCDGWLCVCACSRMRMCSLTQITMQIQQCCSSN